MADEARSATIDADERTRSSEEAYAEARRAVSDRVRLAAVRATGLLDTEVEEVFDRLTRLAVRLVRIPASFISLVDENRDFYKSACGFGEPLASTRELSGPTFCHYAVQSTEPLVIPDTTADPVYREVPTVKSLGVAAYVGVPLVIAGHVIGSFCAIDTKPRDWSEDDLEVLTELAASAQREIELRGALRTAEQTAQQLQEQAVELEVAHEQLQEQAVELQATNDELLETNERLAAARQAAESANKAKAEFLANMSHELRTPLNAIGGYAELMLLGLHGAIGDEQREALERIRRSQKHLLSLISAILDFARVEAGRVEYRLERVVIADAVSEVHVLIEPLVATKGLALTISPPACDADPRQEPLAVHADREKLVQILVNLLSNAVKFTGTGGRIELSWDCTDDRVLILVTDTGRGIPEDKLVVIFEPFAQVDVSRTRTTEGAGLGLAISRDLARGMGGDLTARSELGEGSTFELALPRA